MVTTRKQTEITSAAIAHCIAPFDCAITSPRGTISISKGQDVYSVKSDSSDETYYMTWNSFWNAWDCTCAGGYRSHCKHRDALNSMLATRAAEAFAAQPMPRKKTFHEEIAEIAAKEAEREQYREFEFQMGSYSIPGLY